MLRGHIVNAVMEICGETREALVSVSGWDRAAHIFWLLGPFILLVERSPADIWLSVIALSFAGRSLLRRGFLASRDMGAVGIPFLGRMHPFGITFTFTGLFGWRSIRLVPLSPVRYGGCILAWPG